MTTSNAREIVFDLAHELDPASYDALLDTFAAMANTEDADPFGAILDRMRHRDGLLDWPAILDVLRHWRAPECGFISDCDTARISVFDARLELLELAIKAGPSYGLDTPPADVAPLYPHRDHPHRHRDDEIHLVGEGAEGRHDTKVGRDG